MRKSLCWLRWLILLLLSAINARAAGAPQKIVIAADAEHAAEIAGLVRAQLRSEASAQAVEIAAENSQGAAPSVQRMLDEAERQHARAMFWVAADGPGEWHVYLAVPHRKAVLERQISGLERDAAAIEAVAAIASRASATILESEAEAPLDLSGWKEAPPSPTPKQNDSPRKQATQPTPLNDRTREQIRARASEPPLTVALGYAGSRFAEANFDHGVELALRLLLSSGFWFGLRANWYFEQEVESEFGSFKLRRFPADLAAGYALRRMPWTLACGAGMVLDYVKRFDAEPVAGQLSTDASAGTLFGAEVLGRVEFRLHRHLSVEATGGLDYLFNQLTYASASSPRVVLLRTERLRPRWTIGLGLHWP